MKEEWRHYRLTQAALDAFDKDGGYQYLPSKVKGYCRGTISMRHYDDKPDNVLMIGFAPDGTEFALLRKDLIELNSFDEDLFNI